jgi:hypothetical protein
VTSGAVEGKKNRGCGVGFHCGSARCSHELQASAKLRRTLPRRVSARSQLVPWDCRSRAELGRRAVQEVAQTGPRRGATVAPLPGASSLHFACTLAVCASPSRPELSGRWADLGGVLTAARTRLGHFRMECLASRFGSFSRCSAVLNAVLTPFCRNHLRRAVAAPSP